MPFYAYKAREKNGKAVTGKMEAASKQELAKKLKDTGYLPTKISEASQKVQSQSVSVQFGRVKTGDIILFNTQLSNLVGAGITLLESLKTILQVVVNEKFKYIINRLIKSIASGSSLSQSLGEFPKVFSRLFINMVNAGEQSGTLGTILKRYADYVEGQEDLRQKIKNAIYYPALLVVFGLGIVLFIVTFVIPKFIETFSKAEVELPLPTILVYQFGVGLKSYWHIVLAGIFALAVIIKACIQTKPGKFIFDKCILVLPVTGPLARKIVLSRFSRTLATLLTSGVSLLTSLDMVGDVVGNEVFSRLIRQSRAEVEKGESLSSALQKGGQFPADIIQMIAIGEKAGKMPQMLNKIADYYDLHVSHAVKRLVTLIEPLLIVCMAGVVGLLMASVILPIFDMIKTIQ